MTTKQEWINYCLKYLSHQADLFSGPRKIIRHQTLAFTSLDDSIHYSDVGYSKVKMTRLEQSYRHEESIAVARQMWDKRRINRKFGSVGITTYSHFDKSKAYGERLAMMGPCLQSVILTQLNPYQYSVDVFSRTSEILKKFPCDIIFIKQNILPDFNLQDMEMEKLYFHCASISLNPSYLSAIIPLLDDPIAELKKLKRNDPKFFKICQRTLRNYCTVGYKENLKFRQIFRAARDAERRIPLEMRQEILEFLS